MTIAAGKHQWQPLYFWLALALLLLLPISWQAGFFADDLIQHFALAGNPQLQQQGFAAQGEPTSLAYVIKNQFCFFHPERANYQTLKQSGVLPWWTADNAAICFFRPLASLSHWLDYQLWPASVRAMHLHSLLILLLAYAAMMQLYRHVSHSRTTVLLAMLILVLDVSMMYPQGWLAARNSLLLMLLLPLVLLTLSYSRAKPWWLAVSTMLYLAALLSAEAGVAIAGFILAWLLCLDPSGWRQRLLRLLPFVLVTVLWRGYYQWQGYGAVAVGQYIDPVTAFWPFMQHLLLHYPVLLIHSISALEASDFFIHGRMAYGWAVLGAVLVWLPVAAARQLAVADRSWWFFYLGGLFSLLPMAALTLSDPRVSVLAHIGYAMALARILLAFYRHKTLPILSVAGVFVLASGLMHLLLPMLLRLSLLLVPLPPADAADGRFNSFDGLDIAGRPVLVINSVDPFRLMYHPYRAAWHGLAQAASVRQLMLAETGVTLTRMGERNYHLQQSGGMLLHADDVQRHFSSYRQRWWQHPGSIGGVEGMTYLLLGFFHDGHYRFYPGQRWQFAEASLMITALEQGRPAQLRLQLLRDDVVLVYWDWHSRSYRELATPAIGETVLLRGKYDDTQQRFQ